MKPAPSGADRVYARYWIETACPLEAAAASMAGEQSTGTFTRVPEETDELRERYVERVEQLVEGDRAADPSLPGSGLPKGAGSDSVRRTAEVTLSWPIENMGASLPNLLATIAGNLFELKHFSGLKLLDVTPPPIFIEHYWGPQFAVSGTRAFTGVFGRPLIGTIIKPSVGMTPEATAAQVAALVEANIDFIKDDELQSDGPHCPFEQRIAAVQEVINRHVGYGHPPGRGLHCAPTRTGDDGDGSGRRGSFCRAFAGA
jgi:ribulose-bisphosphate carboxylase large chain